MFSLTCEVNESTVAGHLNHIYVYASGLAPAASPPGLQGDVYSFACAASHSDLPKGGPHPPLFRARPRA